MVHGKRERLRPTYARGNLILEDIVSTIEQEATEVDVDKLMQFVFRAVEEVGATLNTALVVMGDRLGLYRAMAGAGPLAPAELA